MSKTDSKRNGWLKPLVKLSVIVLILACGSLAAYLFLNTTKLTGTEFVSLILGLLLLVVFVIWGENIKELTIAGNSIKLQEVTVKAQDVVERFERVNTVILKNFLAMLKRQPGGFSSYFWTNDPRSEAFWVLIGDIEDINLYPQLRADILDLSTYLAQAQYEILRSHSGDVLPEGNTGILSPNDVLNLVFEKGDFQEISVRIQKTPGEARNLFMIAFREYEKFFNLIQRLRSDEIKA